MKKFFNIVLLAIGLSLFNSCIDDDTYSLTLSSVSEEMIEKESITLTATVSGLQIVNPEIEWRSEDPSIATVDNGTVTAVKEGETTIVAGIADSNVEARCKIIVAKYFITFVNENFEAYCLEYFDINKNGKISSTEANKVEIMNFYTDNIEKLDDITHFKNLVRLYCYGSSSKAGAGALTSLDVSKNTNLKELFCYGNKLTSLDVSKNTNLEELVCRWNYLDSLDISNNTNLKMLWCEGNNIKKIYVWEGFDEGNFAANKLLYDKEGVKFEEKK